tara:strand:+ start:250 stop:1071 length:822 start_codon:yes stop_codon:yes gene_type:complete
MSITRLQQARQMYAMGQRVAKAFGGVMNSDGRRQYGGGSDAGASGGYGYQGGSTNQAGTKGTGPASAGYDGGNKNDDSPSNDPNPNIHGGPTYQKPTINPVDEVALTGFGKVPGVNYNAVGPGSQFAKNTYLTNNFPEYSFNSKIPSLNFLGNTLGKFGYDVNTKFFQKNSIGGKINPATGKPFGYGVDGYKDYMKQRQLGNVGAYGGTELSQTKLTDVLEKEIVLKVLWMFIIIKIMEMKMATEMLMKMILSLSILMKQAKHYKQVLEEYKI